VYETNITHVFDCHLDWKQHFSKFRRCCRISTNYGPYNMKYFCLFFSIFFLALSFNSIFIFFVTEAAQYECSYRRTAHHVTGSQRSSRSWSDAYRSLQFWIRVRKLLLLSLWLHATIISAKFLQVQWLHFTGVVNKCTVAQSLISNIFSILHRPNKNYQNWFIFDCSQLTDVFRKTVFKWVKIVQNSPGILKIQMQHTCMTTKIINCKE